MCLFWNSYRTLQSTMWIIYIISFTSPKGFENIYIKIIARKTFFEHSLARPRWRARFHIVLKCNNENMRFICFLLANQIAYIFFALMIRFYILTYYLSNLQSGMSKRAMLKPKSMHLQTRIQWQAVWKWYVGFWIELKVQLSSLCFPT